MLLTWGINLFNPPNTDNKYIEVFRNMVITDLDSLKVKKVWDPVYIKKGIQALEEKKEILIRPADKGGGILLMTKAYYKEEMKRLLGDRDTYQILKKNPARDFKNKLERLIKKGMKKKVLN